MSSPTRRYYRGHDLVAMRNVQQGQNRHYHFDHQGTTQCLTDRTGAVTDRFANDAWGVQVKRTGSSINRQWYIGNAGYYSHESIYVRARHFQPILARWKSRDPLAWPFWEQSRNVHSQGTYRYTCNAPSREIDPTGLISVNGFGGGGGGGSWGDPCFIAGFLGFGGKINTPKPYVVHDVVRFMKSIGFDGEIYEPTVPVPSLNTQSAMDAIRRKLTPKLRNYKCWCLIAYSWGGGHAANYKKHYAPSDRPLHSVVTIDSIENTPHFLDTRHNALNYDFRQRHKHTNYHAGIPAFVFGPLTLVLGGPMTTAINVPMLSEKHTSIQHNHSIFWPSVIQFDQECYSECDED